MLQKPSQIKFVRPGQMIIFAGLISDPPLGHTRVISSSQQEVRFTVLLRSSRSFPDHGWEVALWHNLNAHRDWTESVLKLETSPIHPFFLNPKTRANLYHHLFAIDIPVPPRDGAPYAFTFKFRTTSSEDWCWANEQFSTTDGEIYLQPESIVSPSTPTNARENLDSYIQDLNKSVLVQNEQSQCPGAKIWSITGDIQAAENGKSGTVALTLGLPRRFTRWFSLVRIWNPWLAPRHGKRDFLPSEDAVMCSFLRWDGYHLLLLAISGLDDVLTVFKHDADGKVIVSARNDNTEASKFQVVAAIGESFESANAAAMYHARKLAMEVRSMPNDVEVEMKSLMEKDIEAKWLENWYDGLTYCTWNALGQNLTEEKIHNALDILKENGIAITNLIIDDNWQSLDNQGQSQFQRGWTRFEANPEGFPKGLKHMIQEIKSKHPKIAHIAVWHALLGYWGGISPTGEIAKQYKTKKVRKQDIVAGGEMTAVDPDDISRMYDDFYRFLSEAGVDSVKTDAQFFLDLLDDSEDRRRFITAYQDAWTINSLRYFSTKAISCMSQTPQILFHTQLPTNKPTLMVRNSDDFFPDVPESHPWHVFCNAHNSLLTQHLNILPDWDMFQTSHPYSSFHAAARCISGGPIYFTDEPGKHNIDLIKQMTAQTPRGDTIILRPGLVGKTIDAYTGYDEQQVLKVGTYTGMQSTGCGMMGVFNVARRAISTFIRLEEFPGVESSEYVIHEYTTREVSKPMKKTDRFALVAVEVEVKGWEILSAHPVQNFQRSGLDIESKMVTKVANLGLLHQMTGSTAVATSDILSVEDDMLVTILQDVIPRHTIRARAEQGVLEIDVEKAWKEMGLNSGWNNEVGVELFIKLPS
ncbi:MAG: hypothetical protein M1834_006738 [Cirrosporium novae-zelandiae]|nr:MAG: hypothetical protein M1834_006738 [Cirrosporium novae-zelandiae]